MDDNDALKLIRTLKRKGKRYPKCKEIKSIENFYRNKCRRDGRSDYCKECKKAARQSKKIIEPKIPTEKQCSFCRVIKSSSEFHRSKNNLDGLQGRCKECAKVTKKASWEKSCAEIERAQNTKNMVNTKEQVESLTREMAENQHAMDLEQAACKKRVALIIQETAQAIASRRRNQLAMYTAIECFFKRTLDWSKTFSMAYRFALVKYYRGKTEIELDTVLAGKLIGKP